MVLQNIDFLVRTKQVVRTNMLFRGQSRIDQLEKFLLAMGPYLVRVSHGDFCCAQVGCDPGRHLAIASDCGVFWHDNDCMVWRGFDDLAHPAEQ